MFKGTVARWQTNFFTGLGVVLPIVITLALAKWLFGTVSNITDTLLFFIDKRITHADGGAGPVLWNWKLLALLVAILGVSTVGRLTRYYIGRKFLQTLDFILMSIPMLNKIYGTIKQVNNAFSSNKKSSFQQVVLVEFPRPGMHSVGFVTGQGGLDIQQPANEQVVSVFVPTTPNPTTGFLLLVPQNKLTPLNITVAEGIKFIISLGSVPAEHSVEPSAITVPLATPATEQAAGATEFITAAVQRATVPHTPPPPSEETVSGDPRGPSRSG